MSYQRVIPRDFFNEAKLLKCMGVLSLAILDCKVPEGIQIEIQDNDEAFDIILLEDGSLTINNYSVKINGEEVIMKTTYNSKSNFPLICEVDYCEYTVFNEDGQFDEEFIQQFKTN